MRVTEYAVGRFSDKHSLLFKVFEGITESIEQSTDIDEKKAIGPILTRLSDIQHLKENKKEEMD
ncbi:MAG TPA: hypothetical protein HA258_00580 [Thermoplasmata archaeon]|jgi:hypothetical protein|nr:hypothetical protein [Thermoplasmata archaeon]HIH29556.1 hypothetical protein [Thermoplasmata archaeon]